MMKNKFMFYKEFFGGKMVAVENLTKAKAKKLYKEAMTDPDLKGFGWGETYEQPTLSQQIILKKAGLV